MGAGWRVHGGGIARCGLDQGEIPQAFQDAQIGLGGFAALPVDHATVAAVAVGAQGQVDQGFFSLSHDHGIEGFQTASFRGTSGPALAR